MKVIYLLILLIAIQLNGMAGEDLNFKWLEGKAEIGELKIKIEENNASSVYFYSSTMKVNYAEEMTIQDVFEANYRNDTLSNASAKRSFDGRVRVSIEEHFKKDSKTRSVRGVEKELDRSANVFDYILLFVKPPVGISKVYSSLYGQNFQVKDNGKNSYTIIGAKNRKETFTYNDKGQLIKAVIDLNVGTYTVVPK